MEVDPVGAVDLGGDGFDLLRDGESQVVEEAEVRLLFALAEPHDLFGQSHAAFASVGPYVGEDHPRAHGLDALGEQGHLGIGVIGEAVDGHHHRRPEQLHVLQVFLQVLHAGPQSPQVLFLEIAQGHTAVHLQSPDGGDQHDAIGDHTGVATLDVEELFRTQIGTEAGFGDAVVAQLEGHTRGLHGVAAMGDVGEGPTVNDGRRVLERLYQVGHEGVFEQHGHGARDLDVLGRDFASPQRRAHDDAIETGLQVFQIGGQTEDGHDLGGNGDVEARAPLHPFAALADGYVPESPVVEIDHAGPGDVVGVDVQLVALEEMVVQNRGAEVMSGGDGMNVAGEVKVDVLHGYDLRVAASGGASLDAEARPQRRLAQGADGLPADLVQTHTQAHVGGRLALAGRGGRDGGAQHQLPVGLVLESVEDVQMDLGLVLPVEVEVVLTQADTGRYVYHGDWGRFLCDLDVALHARRSVLSVSLFPWLPSYTIVI